MSKISIFGWLFTYCNDPDINGCIEPVSHYFPGYTEHQTKPIYPTFYGKAAFKVLYETKHGPIKKGRVVRHLCGNKRCVNINHLREGTESENRLDQYYNKQGFRLVYDKYMTKLVKMHRK
jgi:HNH endonuclease